MAAVATSGSYNDLTNTPSIPAAQIQSDWNQSDNSSVDFIKNKPTIPTVPTNVSAFTNDAGYTTNTGTITGITMNGTSKGTSGVVDLGTVITDISGKQDVIDASHKLDADLVDDTTSTNKFVTASDKSIWNGKQDELVSGTSIKTINNESILGSGNITIQGGGSSYSAGEGIDITNDVISVDIDDEKKTIASALTELHIDKADKNQLNNYQLKGDYQTGEQVDTKIATATSTLRTEAEAINVEKVDAAALTDLNARVSDLEQGGGGSGITGITMNGSAVTVTSGVANLGTVVTDKSDKQDTLVSGTNIKTINNESILGSGNITIQGGGTQQQADWNQTDTTAVDYIKNKPIVSTASSKVNIGVPSTTGNGSSVSIGYGITNTANNSVAIGKSVTVSNYGEVAFGEYNKSVGSGDNTTKTHFSVASYNAGPYDKKNCIEVRNNDDVYIWNAAHTEMIKLQDNLGGGSGITGITMNGSPVTVTSGVADLGTVITEHQSLANYYTKSEIDAMIGQINTLLAAI